MKNNRGI